MVVPSRIELESRASETLILSVVLQDQDASLLGGGRNYELFQQPLQITAEYFDGNGQQHHLQPQDKDHDRPPHGK